MNKQTTPEDQSLIDQIANRANTMAHRYGVPYDAETAKADVTAVHAATGLDLAAMLAAPDNEFAGDMFGIRRSIDRDTGELLDFKPHFAARASAQDAKAGVDQAGDGTIGGTDR